ncbi:MAG TPA: phosphate ABC transporter permease PstA [Polyangiales bacterium]|nr:phosphate ABC transporter permease PstA [Polyangiales bacterium]
MTIQSSQPFHEPFEGVDMSELERSLMRPRTFLDVAGSALTALVTGAALVPLASVLWMLVVRGGKSLSWNALTQAPPAPLEPGGGFGNAILGTLVMVGIAALISIPTGVLAGIRLAQAREDDRIAFAIRFGAKVLTGMPSILAGVFVYGSIVLLMGGYTAYAGGLALAILMLPTIVLTSEEALRMVPTLMHEAAVGMGATSTQAVWMVLLPTALPGILTGVVLAIARAAGETAPLLFTALFSNYWLVANGYLELAYPTASLAVLIFNFSSVPFENQVELAWSAALVLVLMVLATNLIGQALASRRAGAR